MQYHEMIVSCPNCEEQHNLEVGVDVDYFIKALNSSFANPTKHRIDCDACEKTSHLTVNIEISVDSEGKST